MLFVLTVLCLGSESRTDETKFFLNQNVDPLLFSPKKSNGTVVSETNNDNRVDNMRVNIASAYNNFLKQNGLNVEAQSSDDGVADKIFNDSVKAIKPKAYFPNFFVSTSVTVPSISIPMNRTTLTNGNTTSLEKNGPVVDVSKENEDSAFDITDHTHFRLTHENSNISIRNGSVSEHVENEKSVVTKVSSFTFICIISIRNEAGKHANSRFSEFLRKKSRIFAFYDVVMLVPSDRKRFCLFSKIVFLTSVVLSSHDLVLV